MGNILKNILTHSAAAGGGYYLGKKSGGNGNPKHTLFSRFIPTVIFAAGIAYFAFKAPDTVTEVITTSSNNNTRIELQRDSLDARIREKALEKGINIYDNKTLEFDELQKQFKEYKNEVEKYKQTFFDISKQHNKKLDSISDKLNRTDYTSNNNVNTSGNNLGSNISGKNMRDKPGTESNAYNTWLVFDKSDQKFYFYKDNKLVRSGPMIFNKNGNPPNKIYTVQKITPKECSLAPVFIGLEGVIGIAGPGANGEYTDDIYNSINSTNSGNRVPKEDAKYLMNNLVIGSKVEERD